MQVKIGRRLRVFFSLKRKAIWVTFQASELLLPQMLIHIFLRTQNKENLKVYNGQFNIVIENW